MAQKMGRLMPEWLMPGHDAYTAEISSTSPQTPGVVNTTMIPGRQLVLSGTLVTYNRRGSGDTTFPATGLLKETVDITDGPQTGAVVLKGEYLPARLPYTLSSAQIEELRGQGLMAVDNVGP